MVFLFFFCFFPNKTKDNQRWPNYSDWRIPIVVLQTKRKTNRTEQRTVWCSLLFLFFGSWPYSSPTHCVFMSNSTSPLFGLFSLRERIREKSSSSRSPPLSSSSHKTTHGSHPERRFPFSLFKAEACSLLNSPLFSFSTVAREGGEEGCSQVECVRKAFFLWFYF